MTLAIFAVAAMIGAALAVFVAPGHSVGPMGPLTFAGLANGDPVASASLPADVQIFLNVEAPILKEDAKTLGQNVYLARQSLGPMGLDVYAFEDGSGHPCFVVPTEGGGCGLTAESQTPGLYYSIGGGNAGEPSYLLGVASDDIQSIDLTVDSKDVPVSIDNNVAFASFPNTAKAATVTVHYTNGGMSSDSTNLSPAGTSEGPASPTP